MGRNATGGWGGECPTNDLVNEYEVGDPRLTHTIISHGDVFYKADMERQKLMIILVTIISPDNIAVSIGSIIPEDLRVIYKKQIGHSITFVTQMFY